MKIKFMGAAGTVTGSSYVLTSGSGDSILIDLGMFQGVSTLEQLKYDCSTLKGVVLTHAHLDHCGRLPILLSHGFTGDIWMTPPTRDLTELSLLDSAKVAKQDSRPILYDKELAIQTIERFKTVEYRTPFQVGDFTVTFRDAGHILGSASLQVVDMHPDSEIHTIVFSGDLGNTPEPLEQETEYIETADAVVMESTYGDRLHPSGNASDIVEAEVKSIEASGGTLLIPAFSLERTQELLHILMHLKKAGKIKPETPIFMDSPMAEKATVFYSTYAKDLNAHIQADLKEGSPFEFQGLEVILKQEQSQAIYERGGSKVIIAGSGMMTGGRILGHAAHYLPQVNTRLLIVGFQGEGTLGRELLEGKKEVRIGGLAVHVSATVTTMQTMSSHADQGQLLAWLKGIKNVKKVFLTHGEDGPRGALSQKISQELGMSDIALPVLHQEISL